jgi:hypothetical protein
MISPLFLARLRQNLKDFKNNLKTQKPLAEKTSQGNSHTLKTTK